MTAFASLLDQPLAHRLSWTLIHSLWQILALALLAAAALALLKRRSANARYLTACAMLLLMLALPIATFVSLAPVSEPTRRDTSIPAGLLTPLAIDPAPVEAIASPPTPPLAHSPTQLLPHLVPLYFSGILALSLLHLGGWLQVQRLRRTHVTPIDASWRAQLAQLAIQLRVRRHVQLLESTLVQVPAVVGLFQPVILLPASVLTGLTPQQLKSILAHELAHVRRHDYLVNLIQAAIETLLFYHPAVWWLSDRIRQERENCCDDLAAACADRIEYAGALAALEELRSAPPRLALAARGGSLLHRIRRLLNVPDPAPRRWPSLLAAGSAVACVALAMLSLSACAKDRAASAGHQVPVINDPGDAAAAPAATPRFVRIVVGKDALAYEGRPTTWQDLPEPLRNIPEAQRGTTRLELAVESPEVMYGRVLAAQANASRLVKEHGLASLSLVGIHPMTSKGGDAPPADDHVYISGVKNAGAYALDAGKKITLKKLLISAGVPDGPAGNFIITMVRRHGPDKEEVLLRDVPLTFIMDGKQEDVSLQPRDIVEVKSKEGEGTPKP